VWRVLGLFVVPALPARYFGTWHRLGLSYRETDPLSQDFLARGRWALDNEAVALFVADQLAPSGAMMVV
jgi:hypothetical protein